MNITSEPRSQSPLSAPAFDAAAPEVCQSAFALRALLLVQLALIAGVLLVVADWGAALPLLGPVVAAGLVGTLGWLALVCALRERLARQRRDGWRWALLLAAGALMAVLACVPLLALGLLQLPAPRAVALPLAGAALALPLTAWIEGRRRARAPAEARARLAELQSRIRPHFLFNALNSAIALVRVDPRRAEGVLEDLAELFRVALAVPGSSVSLDDELELARRYLAIEQVRFGERLKLEWRHDDAAGAARVPPLLLQPLVENAVRHGIEPADGGGTIRLRTRRRLGEAEIVIANTVAGAPHAGHGIALANVRERLKLMHDLAAQFDVRERDGWYRVRIVVPMEGAA
jgi:two-component system sensor histidine kinase AlgZ